MKNTLKINSNELLTILSNIETPTFTHIVSQTKPKMNKTGNPYFDKVIKTSKGNYFIGGNYEDMVRVRQGKEGMEPDFVSLPCTVGTKVEGTRCVQFNEKLNRYYLQYFIFESSNIKSEYTFEGNTIDKVLFENFLVKKSESSRQPQENKHIPQSFMLSSIKEITLNGTKYLIED